MRREGGDDQMMKEGIMRELEMERFAIVMRN